MPTARVVEEDLRYKFLADGRLALAYNKGHLSWGDFYLSRPNFFPVYSPSGRAVTTNCAYRFNHHKSIFIGHARVNGVNFFHDNNPTNPSLGDIRFESGVVDEQGTRVRLRTTNSWVAKSGEQMLDEEREIVWTPSERVHVLDISSALTSRVGEITFGKDTHSYIGIRVADTIDVEDGGRAVNSAGQVNEAEAMNQFADWVDYSGDVAGQTVGIALMHHPDNPPSPYFVRDYGTFLSNFTLREPYVLPDGGRLVQRFRILVHEGPTNEVDIGSYREAFVG